MIRVLILSANRVSISLPKFMVDSVWFEVTQFFRLEDLVDSIVRAPFQSSHRLGPTLSRLWYVLLLAFFGPGMKIFVL
jgi:hypothetical protein